VALPDDSSLDENQLQRVRGEAARALKEAGAVGVFPTPVDSIMSAARVEEVKEDVLSPSFIDKLRREIGKTGDILKQAVGKVLGLFDARAGLVFIDRSLMPVKQTFIRLHEAAHGFLPWQRQMYAVVEDCKNALEPEIADAFDREANVFASEVLFQGDAFINEAEDHPFEINTPRSLSKRYGSSVYSAIRQFVSKNSRNCAVVVLNPPELRVGDGFKATLRRWAHSDRFSAMFGNGNGLWKECFTPDDQIGAMVPIGKRRASKPREIVLTDRNGEDHECIAEAFTNTYQVFILIHHKRALTQKTVLLKSA